MLTRGRSPGPWCFWTPWPPVLKPLRLRVFLSLSTGLKPPPRCNPSVEFVARAARCTRSCGSWLGTRAVASPHCAVAPDAACSYSPGLPRSAWLPCAPSASSMSPVGGPGTAPLDCRVATLPRLLRQLSLACLLHSEHFNLFLSSALRRNRRMLLACLRCLTNVDVGRLSSANHTAPSTTLAVLPSLRRLATPFN